MPVFSHLYCRFHQEHREDEKWLSRKRMIIETKNTTIIKEWFEKALPNREDRDAFKKHHDAFENKLLYGKPIRKISPKKATEKRLQHAQDELFYNDFWNQYPYHNCSICGTYLGEIMNRSFMHHVLFKGERQFKHLRHEQKNILLVCQCHHDEAHWANPPQWAKDIWINVYKYFQEKGMLI